MTLYTIDETHSPNKASFIDSAQLESASFPIQNLPFCCPCKNEQSNIGVAVGDKILNLTNLSTRHPDILDIPKKALEALGMDTMLGLMRLPPDQLLAIRHSLSSLLDENSKHKDVVVPHLSDLNTATFSLPGPIGDYTDFYASYHHAHSVGKLFRPNQPLLPNYVHIPIGYHGRSSSIQSSPQMIPRPMGQLKALSDESPRFDVCAKLDFELELGIFIGQGNPLGEPIPIEEAEAHVFGYCLLNDWSARDIQAWEYQPLGPFLGKSFASTLSPFIVTSHALAPFRIPHKRPSELPAVLPYLTHSENSASGALDITLNASLKTASMNSGDLDPVIIVNSNTKYLLWTPAQMVAHHSSNGCNLQPCDLFGSGTISGPDKTQAGSLLELTDNGATPITLPHGEVKGFLDNGDTISLEAWCTSAKAKKIGFGAAIGTIRP